MLLDNSGNVVLVVKLILSILILVLIVLKILSLQDPQINYSNKLS